MRHITIGSRRSKLAMTQTNWVIEQLQDKGVPYDFSIKEIVTQGDRILDVTLSKIGGKALFVKEIEQALLDGEIDFAVHSMKDVPSALPEPFVIACIPEREDERDAFISESGKKLHELPEGAVVGTSSLRRAAQVLSARPDVKVVPLRGNIDTRLRKLKDEPFDAIILAAAGLKRMGWSDDVVTSYLSPEECVPAVGQGALAIECRKDDIELIEQLQVFHHEPTAKRVNAERAFLFEVEGSCQIPVAGWAELVGDGVRLTALVASPDGTVLLKETVEGNDPMEVGQRAARLLLERGAGDIITQVKNDSSESDA
ncbi:hydroxymethylbilane synthase [Bacillaceae bacterium SIJ1]|uniref:hydroxymethylbilane synthase n=1 Tax=Litoribacterium kuwaitense TaxID=1398745 RepID=UPI0013EDFCFF|nr:hydroxymethylbilane synthase [Litoribacterium kuwaitense]NGP45503.1 hydroxymethylbilane synthase [Litoribacterium kuwaitense]